MTIAAERVPTSRRTLYKFIRNAIYEWDDIDIWTELGLIRVWDLPEVEFEWAEFPNEIWFGEYQAAVICLMCHRLIGHIVLFDRLYDSSLVEGIDGRVGYWTQENERIRGHLIAHFHLGARPWPNESWESIFGLASHNPRGSVARRWIDLVEPIAVGIANNHQQLILPVIDGVTLTEDEVREYYRNLL
jgi:hypothetical protein